MQLRTDIRSPNFSDVVIPVEFVVIHYTALSLAETLNHLSNPSSNVSSHLVIDRDGSVFELVDCLNNAPKRAWHAGRSHLTILGQYIEEFNDRSIGIELVNLNGNVLPFSDAQYKALIDVLNHLKGAFPNLNNPNCIVGHEEIAGFRGKCDPGLLFDWNRVLNGCFPNHEISKRSHRCPHDVAQRLKGVFDQLGVTVDDRGGIVVPKEISAGVFAALSSLLETLLVNLRD
jgi:N-acetylmuramoyl-L-alanine amidase